MLSQKTASPLLLTCLLSACGAPSDISSGSPEAGQQKDLIPQHEVEVSACDIRGRDTSDCFPRSLAPISLTNCRSQPCISRDNIKLAVPGGKTREFDSRVQAYYYSGTDWWLHNATDDCWMWEGNFAYDCL